MATNVTESESENNEEEEVDVRNTDLSWDNSSEVPTFFNCSLEQELFSPVTRGPLYSSTNERFLEGLSFIGANLPVLRSPGPPDLSFESDMILSCDLGGEA